MSQTVWNILGICTILALGLFLSTIHEQWSTLTPDQPPPSYLGVILFSGVLVVIAIACLVPKSRPFTLRIVGAIGIAGCIFSLIEGFKQQNFAQFPITLIFWLPGSVYLTIKGKMNDDPPT